MEKLRRSKRQKVAVDYARLDESGFDDCARVQHRRLAKAVLKWGEGQTGTGITETSAEELAHHVYETGFRSPCLVRAVDGTPTSANGLGIRIPQNLTIERLAKYVGYERQIETIDVATQSEGPLYSMEEWLSYFCSSSPKKPLLNVVSLDLEKTHLQKLVSAPFLVKDLDLVEKAWPLNNYPLPTVQLYAIMSVAGCFMDFHLDFGGSSVWYHILSGKKVFLLVPPTKGNLLAFEEWASSDKQASVFFADRVSECKKVELSAGDTLFLPGGWPHCVVTPFDSIAIGGNFLTGYNLSLQLEVWQMEERLKVRRKFRFPLYKQLMWHTAACYLEQMKAIGNDQTISAWELEGLPTLLRCLKVWLQQARDGGDIPDEVIDPSSLLRDLEAHLKNTSAKVDLRKVRVLLKPRAPKQLEADDIMEENKHNPADRDSDFEPENDSGSELDDDMHVEDSSWKRAQYRPSGSHKKKEMRLTEVGGTKKATSPPPARTYGRRLQRPQGTVRERLMKKMGYDPKIPFPTPKPRSKESPGKDPAFSMDENQEEKGLDAGICVDTSLEMKMADVNLPMKLDEDVHMKEKEDVDKFLADNGGEIVIERELDDVNSKSENIMESEVTKEEKGGGDGSLIDAPVSTELEVTTDDEKGVGAGSLFDVPVGMGDKLDEVVHLKGNDGVDQLLEITGSQKSDVNFKSEDVLKSSEVTLQEEKKLCAGNLIDAPITMEDKPAEVVHCKGNDGVDKLLEVDVEKFDVKAENVTEIKVTLEEEKWVGAGSLIGAPVSMKETSEEVVHCKENEDVDKLLEVNDAKSDAKAENITEFEVTVEEEKRVGAGSLIDAPVSMKETSGEVVHCKENEDVGVDDDKSDAKAENIMEFEVTVEEEKGVGAGSLIDAPVSMGDKPDEIVHCKGNEGLDKLLEVNVDFEVTVQDERTVGPGSLIDSPESMGDKPDEVVDLKGREGVDERLEINGGEKSNPMAENEMVCISKENEEFQEQQGFGAPCEIKIADEVFLEGADDMPLEVSGTEVSIGCLDSTGKKGKNLDDKVCLEPSISEEKKAATEDSTKQSSGWHFGEGISKSHEGNIGLPSECEPIEVAISTVGENVQMDEGPPELCDAPAQAVIPVYNLQEEKHILNQNMPSILHILNVGEEYRENEESDFLNPIEENPIMAAGNVNLVSEMINKETIIIAKEENQSSLQEDEQCNPEEIKILNDSVVEVVLGQKPRVGHHDNEALDALVSTPSLSNSPSVMVEGSLGQSSEISVCTLNNKDTLNPMKTDEELDENVQLAEHVDMAIVDVEKPDQRSPQENENQEQGYSKTLAVQEFES